MDADLERLAGLLPPAAIELGQAWRPGGDDREAVLRDLLLPLLLEPDWPGPASPLPVGDGWVQPDLTDNDLDTFDRLRQSLPHAGPEELAAAAQAWRLPVLPYRRLPVRVSPTLPPEVALALSPAPPHPSISQDLAPGSRVVPASPGARSGIEGARVLDLSSLWAGPLCTQLLVEAGADVLKLDPDCRPDGFRERVNLYAELNRGKRIVSLDLRLEEDRASFEALVADTDVLIDSFSRRVLPNLGYDQRALRQLNPNLSSVSIVGFANGSAQQDWLTYGSGIHAISGLGLLHERAQASAVAYPDPLTGYAAFHAVAEVLGTDRHREVALATAGIAVAELTANATGVARGQESGR